MTDRLQINDYIAGDMTVFMKVVSIIEGPPVVYGVTTIQEPGIDWLTQTEIDRQGYKKGTPQFDKFARLEIGDVIKNGPIDKNDFVVVLARIGEAILLSQPPNEAAGHMMHFIEHLRDRHGADIAAPPSLKDAASNMKSKSAAGEWFTVYELALLNWHIVSEEN